jgi:hypothetical protein
MSVEMYFCRNCDYSSEGYSLYTGMSCPSCAGPLDFGRRAEDFKPSGQVRRNLSRRRPTNHVDPTASDLYRKFSNDLIEMKMSEEDEFYRRKMEAHKQFVTRKEAYKRQTEAAPIVFATFRTSVTEELSENERLFNGIEVRTTDQLSIPDFLEDSDVEVSDYWSDIPLGEMIAPF